MVDKNRSSKTTTSQVYENVVPNKPLPGESALSTAFRLTDNDMYCDNPSASFEPNRADKTTVKNNMEIYSVDASPNNDQEKNNMAEEDNMAE